MLAEQLTPSQFPRNEFLTWLESQPHFAQILDHYAKDPRLVRLIRDVFDHHPPTYTHLLVVAYLSHQVALATNPDLASACFGDGLVHDTGKVNVPINILEGGKLTGQQRLTLRKHPRDSFELLKGIDPGMALVSVAHHELQPDGYPRSGYRLHSDPLIEYRRQIQACSDEVEAMMSERPYKEAWCANRTARRLRRRFVPQLVQTAIRARSFLQTQVLN